MQPTFRLTAGGADITARVRDRLMSLQFQDVAEDKSDRLTIKLDDRPVDGVHVEFPEPGATLKVWIGYADPGTVFMGSFKVTDISYSAPPATMEIKALAADMPSAFRTPVDRSWQDTTMGEVVSTIASEHGYAPKIDPALGAVKIAHADQVGESPMAFATRLASNLDAVVRPVNETLVLAAKGEAKTASGATLPGFTLRPEKTTRWRYSRTGRDDASAASKEPAEKTGAVQAASWSVDDAEPKVAVAGDSDVPERVRYWHQDLPQAEYAAAAGKNTRDRAKAAFRFTMPGDTALVAEQRLTLDGFRAGVPTTWRVLEVQHELTPGGYTCSCRAELFQAAQEGVP